MTTQHGGPAQKSAARSIRNGGEMRGNQPMSEQVVSDISEERRQCLDRRGQVEGQRVEAAGLFDGLQPFTSGSWPYAGAGRSLPADVVPAPCRRRTEGRASVFAAQGQGVFPFAEEERLTDRRAIVAGIIPQMRRQLVVAVQRCLVVIAWPVRVCRLWVRQSGPDGIHRP